MRNHSKRRNKLTYPGQKNILIDSCAYLDKTSRVPLSFSGIVVTCHMGDWNGPNRHLNIFKLAMYLIHTILFNWHLFHIKLMFFLITDIRTFPYNFFIRYFLSVNLFYCFKCLFTVETKRRYTY